MLLVDSDGPNRLAIQVTGYQFPDAPEPAKRFSWHMVGGEARCQEGSWRFHWQALTCDESPQVSAWLTEVADAVVRGRGLPGSLRFLEPDLGMRAGRAENGRVQVRVSFDLEFQPPWHERHRAGDPYMLVFTMSEADLRRASRQWDTECARFPGALPARISAQVERSQSAKRRVSGLQDRLAWRFGPTRVVATTTHTGLRPD